MFCAFNSSEAKLQHWLKDQTKTSIDLHRGRRKINLVPHNVQFTGRGGGNPGSCQNSGR